MSENLDLIVKERAEKWLSDSYDEETRKKVKQLIDNDPKELTESFYKDLEFGTGGLRGIMGVGTNRMNVYTVGMATQGLSNYLKKAFPDEPIRVAVGHDSRNNSRLFAERVADIFAANGFKVYLFDSLRPTPELSFAIRHLHCHSGVVVTASHNPKEYNGYKAYWSDGAQVVAPHDRNIIAEVQKITSPDQVMIWKGDRSENIEILDETFDQIYLEAVHGLSLSPDAVERYHDMKIVYTPLHGTGVILVPESLRKYGFTNILTVKEQNIPDGNFPTVESPNPEERSAMKMAIELAESEKAEVVLATDPDADRIGMALRDENGQYVLLNGNQTCSLLVYYIVKRWSELGRLRGKEYIVKTIVTTELVARIAESFGVRHFDCLTGFKYIATVMRNHEQTMQYICGGEESFGFLAEDFVRDKDAVSACSLAAEAAAWAKSQDMTLYELLKEMYVRYGFFREALVSVVRKGKEGQEEIAKMMSDYRSDPPRSLGGSPIVVIKDYLNGEALDLANGSKTPIDMERSNVLQFTTADSTVVSIRPSGTEPKIKFYFGVRAELNDTARFGEVQAELDGKIESIKKEMGLV
ncbi:MULTISPECIES: phospho-sugar mutase [Alistipes]|jgi:phosphomannomutase|uniref:phospho-sugar mutase n=1 Tax=Alistipes TaxID=239759 RepID=UPI001DB8C992|nr:MULTISPECIES: phospho-sugar mutase [Alistipes]MBS1365430.1 phospho-sugar mutase [Alistipes sp.]HJG74873.1 phospho-sugar mutase [Alistipes ihumii]